MKLRRPTVENRGWAWWIGCALSLCLLLGAIAYWASIWLAPAVRIAPAGTLSDQSGPLNLAQAQGLFGQVVSAAPQVVEAAASNIKVIGILAAGQKGSAILTIDGKPGKVYLLGDRVDGQLKLIAVDLRQVTLGQAGNNIRQTLAVPPKADISVLTNGPGKTATASGTLAPGPFQLPGSSQLPTPMSSLNPPPPIVSPPPIQNPGPGNNPGGTQPPGINPGLLTNPGVSTPAPVFPAQNGPNPGSPSTQ
jgi:general secretion pathway protein C